MTCSMWVRGEVDRWTRVYVSRDRQQKMVCQGMCVVSGKDAVYVTTDKMVDMLRIVNLLKRTCLKEVKLVRQSEVPAVRVGE